MQTTNSSPGPHDIVSHPTDEIWMAFLYGETSPPERAALTRHLARCSECRAQLDRWRSDMKSLDAWTVARSRRRQTAMAIPLRWATAAAVVLVLALGWGRVASSQAREMEQLRREVARLSTELPRQHAEDLRRVAQAATDAAAAETTKLLAEFAEATGAQRDQDRQALAAALQRIDARFDVLRNQIETVAINTETTFAQTRQDLTRLAALSVPTDTTAPRPAGTD